MSANWEKLEKNTGVLKVEVEAEKVAGALDQAFNKVVKKVNVPGFRKGKVPRSIFEGRFGVESLYQDAIDILLPEAYVAAIDEAGIEPIDRPEIDVEQFEKGKPFIFTAKVQVKPEVKLGDYKGLEVPEKDFSVSEADIEAELKNMQQRQAELVVVEEGAAENGDTVVIDFEGFVDGEAFEGGKAEGYSLELGSNSFIPGFEEQLVGMQKEEDKDVNVTFPEEYHAENLKGKEALFKVKLHEIKRKNLPELDDEFAKDVSEFETLDEYKADIENKLKEKKEHEADHYREGVVVEKAAENAEVEVPDVMVETEIGQMLKDFENRLSQQGMNLDLYYQFSGQSEEQLKEQMKEDAAKRVRNNLVLEAIAAAEKVEVTEEDINNEFEQLSEMYKQPAADLRKLLEDNGTIETLKADMLLKKTILLLVEESKSVAAAAE
ncbi:trigger factor [Marinicrinis sediminis]|uniref:Trigger factor n=1 Tax=Marinicrinis sediminis TaxID=1652465 RepID=A0ABW5R7E7_9BACL